MVGKFGLGLAMMLALAAPTDARTRAVAAKGTNVAAAVAAPGRSADNLKLDESRKPAEILAFLGVAPGMHVADMVGGNRYWAEMLSPIVGPAGRVMLWVPTQFYSDKSKEALAAFTAAHDNVSLIVSPFQTPALAPRSIDRMLINLDYHDVYWESAKRNIPRQEPGAWAKTAFAAMKPGGVLVVIDHVGQPGDTRAIVEALHRIDPAVVRADFEGAGFTFDGSSDLLRNPADDHSLLVFDDKIRGKTDRFIYRFKKPA